MKYLQFSLLIVALITVSCHSKVALVPDDCCAKAHAAAAMDMQRAGSTSIYQLAGWWTDQDNRQIDLGTLRGRVQLVAMVYTHCGYTCPRLVEDMKSIRRALPDSIRDKVGFVLVTLDPERDTPSRLRQFADQKQLGDNWELLRGNSEQVRELSMVLNVQYRSLGNGDFSHSGNILVLDREGRVIQSLQGTRAAEDGVALVDRLATR